MIKNWLCKIGRHTGYYTFYLGMRRCTHCLEVLNIDKNGNLDCFESPRDKRDKRKSLITCIINYYFKKEVK